MPYLEVRTNCEVGEAQRLNFLNALIPELAELTGKPPSIFMGTVEAASAGASATVSMVFRDSEAPCAYAQLSAIALDPALTPDLTRTITNALGDHFQLEADRVFVRFQDTERTHWGVGGKTLAE